MDLTIFATPEAWISLVTLIFLEMILGVDNLVFIAITTDRLPEDKQHIGRKLGLAGALIMRIMFLSLASFLIHMTNPIFTLEFGAYTHGVSIRDLILMVGGGYLIVKGIKELRAVLDLEELKASASDHHKKLRQIALPQAIGTIMVMDLVFSIDSVITAVGLAEHLIIMIIAVMIAVFMMMIFIDPISNFINKHPEMKILALFFITAIGVLLVLDGAGLHTGIEMLGMHAEKLMVYFAMIFAVILQLIQMAYNKNVKEWRRETWKTDTERQIERVRAEMLKEHEEELGRHDVGAKKKADANGAADAEGAQAADRPTLRPVIIGNNVYVMTPLDAHDNECMRELLAGPEGDFAVDDPIEIEPEYEVLDED